MAKCTEIKLFARLGTVEKTKSEKEKVKDVTVQNLINWGVVKMWMVHWLQQMPLFC